MMLRRSLAAVLLSAFTFAALAQSGDRQQKNVLPKLDGFEHVNSIVVPDPQSDVHGFHHFFLGEKGRDTFKKTGKKQFPAGTVFVGKVYEIQKTEDGAFQEGDLAAFTVMRKAPDDPQTRDTGGWLFQKFNPQGNPVEIDAVSDCFRCHKPHEETDFVISTPNK